MAGTPLGYIKSKLGLKGPTKPGEMIARMNDIKSGKVKVEKAKPQIKQIIKETI